MITILVKAADGTMIASAQSAEDARLCIDRVYEDGDTVEILADEKHLCVQMDVTLLPGEVYLPNGWMTWRVPAGEHRLAYAPGAFETKRHVITARPMTAEEINGRRDIACNPADLRGETDFFPHITANVETRNEACFCARNAINGLHCNNYHGEWPFGSWGIGAREDAWCCIDFGREVTVDAMALILRVDFPHDAYWVSGHVVLSDGAEVAFDLQKTGERQIIPLGKHTVRWMRLERMQKSDDPSAFPALTEWEVCGCDKEGE